MPSWRSWGSITAGPSVRLTWSAAATPPDRHAWSRRLVVVCARVGPVARRCASARPSARSRSAGVTRLNTPHDASVSGGEHHFGGASRADAGGESLGPTGIGDASGYGLDLADLAAFSRPDQVAG